MDLTIIYSKTSKGSRLRSSMFGGLSSSLMKVLALINGKSNVVEILSQLDDITEKKLAAALVKLEKEGYIKPIELTVSDDWLRVSRFSPMVVEEFDYIEEIEAKAEKDTLLEIERKELEAEYKAKAQVEDELKAQEVVEQIHVKEKAKAEEMRKKTEAGIQAKIKEKARLEAEQKEKLGVEARQKLEHKASEDMEKVRVKSEADEKWRLETERTARKAEELKKTSEAKAKAEEITRLEAEHKTKLEADARLKAEYKAREVMEKIRAKEKTKAEVEAQVKTVEKARQEAEEKAKTKEKERVEVERIEREAEDSRIRTETEAQAKAEEKVQLEAQQKAKLEAEATARLKAEFKAREVMERIQVKAKEKERIEMERIAREEEVAQKKAEAGEKLRLETEHKAKAEVEARLKESLKTRENIEKNRIELERIACEAEEKAEVQAKIKADEKVRKEADRIAKKVEKAAYTIQKLAQQEAEEMERVEVKRLARNQNEEQAKVSVQDKTSIRIRIPDPRKWVTVSIKIMLVYLPLGVLLAAVLLQLINLSMLVNSIEKLAAETIGKPVTINEVHVALWPEAHLVLENVSVGASSTLKSGGLKIRSVYIFPVISTLFENVKIVKSLEISGMKIDQDNFGQPLQWINSSNKAEHVKIERFNFNRVDLKIRDLALDSFEGSVGSIESHGLVNIDFNSPDHTLSVLLTPNGNGFNVVLTATKWALPVNHKIVFDELKARGILNQDQIDFSQIYGHIYEGSITAKATVNWSKQWIVTGNFNLSKSSTPQILKAFGSGGSVDGKLNLMGNFSSKSAEAAKLADDADITASFEIKDGKIYGIDLARTIQSNGDKSLAGYATNFDKLTGSLIAKGGRFQYKNLILKTAQLQAQGDLDIQPNQDVSGNISTNVVAQSRSLQTRFNLAGKINNVKQQ